MLNIGFLLDVEVKYVCLTSLRKLLLKELNVQVLEVNSLALIYYLLLSLVKWILFGFVASWENIKIIELVFTLLFNND